MLVGDASKAKAKLDWSANVHFGDLIRIMVEADLAQVRKELYGTSCELSVAHPVPARAGVR